MNINDQLFIAAQVGDVNLAINLLALRADVDAVHKVGVTALYIAAQNGHLALVELLLKNGADPEIKFSNGMTPLINAAFNGKADVVQMLIDYGADIEAKIGNATVLHIAAQNGQRQIVKLLLENGASLEKPAIVATMEQNMLEILLQQGSNRLKTIGCFDGLSREVFASEGINYDEQNKILIENSAHHLSKINEYAGRNKIPHITHQIYFTSKDNPKEIDDLSLGKMILSAKRLNEVDANWKHYIWTNNLSIIPESFTNITNVEIKNIDEVQDSEQHNLLQRMFKESEIDKTLFAKISDLFRYIALNKFGGIYFDLDYEIYRAAELLKLVKAFDSIGGKELDKDLSAIGNSFIASAANHHILNEALNLLSRNLNQNIDRPDYVKYPCSNWHKTWFDSGPALISSAVYRAANNGTLDVILPSNVLYNVEYARSNAPGSRCYDSTKIVKTLDKETIGADMFCGSWSATENFLNPIYYEKNNDAYLFEAALFGYTRIVEYFLNEKKANIEYATAGGHTPLYAAIYGGKIETVKYLISANASITDNSHRFTPFYIASALGLNRNASPKQKQVRKIVKAGYDKVLAEFHKQPEPGILKKTEYVFARYNEPIDRIKEELPKNDDLVYIYNKGEELTDFPAHLKIINVENKGLDPQAYLKHIVDNYDNFIIRGIERVALFQAMPDDHPANFPLKLYATNITSNCDNTIGKCERTTIQTELDNMERTIKTEGWKTFDGGKYANVVIRDYSLERYINELICPFPKDKEFTINWGNQFAVDVDVIMRHPKEYYQRILDRMDIQFPGEVHFFERTNDLMFEPCPYNEINIDYAGDVAL
jgi:ankyrin repeat protein